MSILIRHVVGVSLHNAIIYFEEVSLAVTDFRHFRGGHLT